MDDYISRQAAINAADRADYTGLAVEDVKKVTDEVVKELKKLPSVEQWIPVSEDLPKNEDWVSVTILDESGDTPFRYTDFGWYLDVADCWIVDSEKRTDVIAWMPKPKPWR